VDFVVVGSGSAGGIVAKELASAGFDVVLLEQGQYRTAADFNHDEIDVLLNESLIDGGLKNSGQTFRSDPAVEATTPSAAPAQYAMTVGGSSVHFSANFWRLREGDF
jgi:choline dehydrogenase-like flavoprotein